MEAPLQSATGPDGAPPTGGPGPAAPLPGLKPRTIGRILVLVLLAALVPGLVLQALLHVQRFHTEQNRELQVHRDVARAVAVAFRASIEDLAQEARALGLAILRFAPQDHEAAGRFLAEALRGKPAAAEMAWLSPQGRVIASSRGEGIGEDRQAEAYLRGLGPDRPWILGPVQPDRQSAAATFTVAAMVDDAQGRILGILTITMDAEGFADAQIKIRRSPDAGFIVLDNNGVAAFHRPFFPFAQWQSRDFSREEFVAAALAGQQASGILDLPMTGTSWFTARVPVADLGWVAGAGRQYDSVMGPLWQDLWLGMGLSALCLLISGGLALHYGKVVLTDLQGLQEAVTAWGQSRKTAVRPAIGSIAEVNTVARAFEMAVTRREEAERAWHREQHLLASVLQATDVMLVLLDARFNFVWVNPAYADACRMTPEQLVGQNHFALYPNAENEAIFRKVRDTGEGVFFKDKPFVFPDQPERQVTYWDWSLTAVKDTGGTVTGLVFSLRETTKYKRAEEALRRLSQFPAENPNPVLRVGLDGEVLYANGPARAWLQSLGGHADGPLPEAVGAIVTEARGKGHPVEREIRAPGGSVFWISAIRPAGEDYVNLYGSDITASRKAAAALRQSESKYRNLFNNMTEEVHFWEIVRDPAGAIRTWRLVDVNPPALRSWGKSSAEAIRGKTTDEIFGPGATDHFMPVVQKIMSEGVPYAFEDYFPHLNKHFRFTSVPWGEFFITTGSDITAIKKAHEALRQLNETLEQQVAERTALAEARARQLQALAVELIEAEEKERRRVADLLHDDLQQILASARMQLQAACAGLPPDPILANVEKLMAESIAKSRRLSHELSPAVLHHSGLVEAMTWLVRQMKDQFGLAVALEAQNGHSFENGPLKVFLFRAVQELLFNVVKHAGVKNASVEVSEADGGLAITVRDQGRGFDPDVLDSHAKTAGFGLLSLRERVRYIGGELVIASAPGQGSCFTLTVPVTLDRDGARQDQGTEAPPATLSTSEGPAGPGGIRVLFVDDHPVMRQGLIRLMAGQPVIQVVGEAANGIEALEGVRQLKPDVVVMDVSMPVMDGIEATRRIKAEAPGVRVIGLSMHDDEQLAAAMREAGAEAFMSKTASSADVLKAIYGITRIGQSPALST